MPHGHISIRKPNVKRRDSTDSAQTASFVGSYHVKRKKQPSRSNEVHSEEGDHPSGRSIKEITKYRSALMSQLSKDSPAYYEFLKPTSVYRKPMRREAVVPTAFSDSYKIQHPDLTKGEKEYLWYIGSVYSMTDMKKHVEKRFINKLQHQIDIGSATPEECAKYYRYITRPRKKQYEADTDVWRKPPKIEPRPKHFHQRSRTAPPGFSNSHVSNLNTHPKGSHLRSASASSLHTSMKGLSLYYNPDIKQTLQGRRKKEPLS